MNTRALFRRHFSLIVLTVYIFCTAAAQPVSAQSKGLSYAQVEHLVKLHAPDGLVASQIRSRGVSFTLTAKTLDAFKSEGAGSETIAALREQIRVGVLQVRTVPGSDVLLDGEKSGSADSEGVLQIQDVPVGNHAITVTKAGYKDGATQASVFRNFASQVSVPLQWLGGFLTITVQPAQADITVSGPTPLKGTVTNALCPPGAYTATVSLDGYLSQNRSFQVAAGEHHVEAFQLVVDPAILNRELNEAKSLFRSGDAAAAVPLANTVLKQQPNNPDAEALIAEAAFKQGNMNLFVNEGAKAIRGGKSITVYEEHVHIFFVPRIHPVRLTVSRAGIALESDPPYPKCKLPESLSFDQIADARVQNSPQGFVELHIQYASKPHGAILHDMDFVPEGSKVVSSARPGQMFTSSMIRVPNDTVQALSAILALVMSSKR